MKFTTLLSGVAADPRDLRLTEAIASHPADYRDVRLQKMQIGIRNHQGAIYRAFGIATLREFMDTMVILQKLDLVDETEHQAGTKEGFDAVFMWPRSL